MIAVNLDCKIGEVGQYNAIYTIVAMVTAMD